MPFYSFEHPETGEIKEVLLSMDSLKIYIDENNVKWNRLYSLPQLGRDTKIDPFSKRAFLEKTNKAGTFGELFDLSKEMSEKRGGKQNDPVKKKFSEEWKKKRNKAP
jgi:hypothetical protein